LPPEEDPPDEELPPEDDEDDEEVAIFITLCRTRLSICFIIVGDWSAVLTAEATAFDPAGLDKYHATAVSSAFSPCGEASAVFSWPVPSDSAMNFCILGVSSSSLTAFWSAKLGSELLPPPDSDPPPPL